MAAAAGTGKLYHLFTSRDASSGPGRGGGSLMLVGIAVAMFVAMFAWGGDYFGWSDPEGKVQLALFTSFILGIIGGYKAKGD
jgi:hypothetical protein